MKLEDLLFRSFLSEHVWINSIDEGSDSFFYEGVVRDVPDELMSRSVERFFVNVDDCCSPVMVIFIGKEVK